MWVLGRWEPTTRGPSNAKAGLNQVEVPELHGMPCRFKGRTRTLASLSKIGPARSLSNRGADTQRDKTCNTG